MAMQYRCLGRSGLKISEIGVGSWLTFGSDELADDRARECVDKAIDLGVNFFDTADVYAAGAAETFLGEALAGHRRSSIVLATKCHGTTGSGPNDRGGSRKHIVEACEASLKRLRTDYIDLYQCHWHDPDTPFDETVRAMDHLIRQGKVLYWGVSNYSAQQVRAVITVCERYGLYRPISHQPRYNMLQPDPERELMGVCDAEGLGMVVYSPLAQGVLTGKYSGDAVPKDSRAVFRGIDTSLGRTRTPETLAKVDRLKPIAEDLGLTLAQLSLAWCLRRKELGCVIIGATRPEQVADNCGASGVTLDEQALARIDAVLNPE